MAGLVPAIHDLNSLDPQDSLRSPGASPRHGRACPGHPRLELARSPGLAALVRGFRLSKLRLLKLNLCTDLFERGLDLVGLVLGHAFLDGLRRALNKVLGFFQAKPG
jgi:hypothetical protein